MRALRPIHKHAQTSQVSTVTKWEIAGYAGMLEGNAARAAAGGAASRRTGGVSVMAAPGVGGCRVCAGRFVCGVCYWVLDGIRDRTGGSTERIPMTV